MPPTSPPSDLGLFLDDELFPALWERLDSAFPEFGFVHKADHWQATDETATRALIGSPRPERVWAYRDTPFGFKVHGGDYVPWVRYLAGGQTPRGEEFLAIVRDLARRAGLEFPEWEPDAETLARLREGQRKGDLLETVVAWSRAELAGPGGEAAREYLAGRDFSEEAVEALEFGVYPELERVREAMVAQGFGVEEIRDAGLLPGAFGEGGSIHWWPGRVIGPWRNAAGRIVNLWARDISGGDVERKYLLLKGGSRGVPFGLHGSRGPHLVLVEGIMDVLALRAMGERQVVGLGGAGMGLDQVEALAKAGVRSVTLLLDHDLSERSCDAHGQAYCLYCSPGQQGTLQAVRAQEGAGYNVYVVDPGVMADNGNVCVKVDPDSFVRRHGVEAFRALVQSAERAGVFRARKALEQAAMTCERERDEALGTALSQVGELDPRDRETVLKIAAHHTGYALETLQALAEERGAAQARERARAELARVLDRGRRDAQAVADAGSVAREVGERLREFHLQHCEGELPGWSVDGLLERVRAGGEGKRSGWGELDGLGVRFHPTELTVIGARTGHGKTTVLLSLLLNWLARYKDERFAFFSFELPPEAVLLKLASALTRTVRGLPWTYYEARDWLQGVERHGGYPPPESLEAALARLREWEPRLQIIYSPGEAVDRLAAQARRWAAEGEAVGGVLVDYLQLVAPPSGQYDRRDIEVSQVARGLKALAVDLSCPVVAAAQIGRQAAQQSEKIPEMEFESRDVQKAIKRRRPQLHHLREGGSEQEADLIIGLLNYRADYLEERDAASTEERGRPGPLEMLVLKNRFGDLGVAKLVLEGRTGTIRDAEVGDLPEG